MNTNKNNILAFNAEKIMLFDKTSLVLYNLGAMRKDSLKTKGDPIPDMLNDGTPNQSGVDFAGEGDLLQTSATDIALYDGAIGHGCHIWLVAHKATTIIKDTDIGIGQDGKFTYQGANAAKMKFSIQRKKVSDILWQIEGFFDPTNIILLTNPALQKTVGATTLLDCGNYDRNGVWSGMTSAAWNVDGVSLAFDGSNDFISFADSEFRGVEMIGSTDANNRTFASGIGNWTNSNSGNTFASAAGGYSGNGGKLTIGGTPSTNLLSLSTDLTSLVVGQSYHYEARLKYETAWNGGYIQSSIGGVNKRVVLTSSYVLFSYDFVAQTTTPTITVTCKTAPTTGDIMWIDSCSLSLASQANLNKGEMILSASQRDFEQNSLGDWAAVGTNHSAAADSGQHHTGAYSMKITATGNGSQTTNYVALPYVVFNALEAGKNYTLEFWAYTTDGGAYPHIGLGSAGQTKTWTNLIMNTWGKCVWNFTAAAGDVEQELRIWLTYEGNGILYVDDFSLTEAVDATVIAWVKRNGNPSADEYVVSKFNSTDPGYFLGIKGSDNNVKASIRGDNAAVTVNGSTTSITDNAWHMIVATITRSGSLQCYADAGIDEGSASLASLGKVESVHAVVLGADAAPSGYFTGSLGIVNIIVGEAWTQEKVIDFYNSVKGVYGL